MMMYTLQRRILALVLLPLVLWSCDQRRDHAAPSSDARAQTDDRPTNEEITATLRLAWQREGGWHRFNPPGLGVRLVRYQDALTFVSAEKVSEGMTDKNIYSVQITQTFLASQSFPYNCSGVFPGVYLEGVALADSLKATAGQQFKCSHTMEFKRINEGWLPVDFSEEEFLIRRN